MAVNTGMRLEKIFDLLIPSSLTEWAKKTNDTEEAKMERRNIDVTISRVNGTKKADFASNKTKNGRKRKIPITFCLATRTMAEYFMVSLRSVTVYNKAANTAQKRNTMPFGSAVRERLGEINIVMTPANETAIPMKLTGASFSLTLR